MSYIHELRHKAIIVPVVRSKENKFLTVKDSRHQEWIFVTGGCKKSEIQSPLKCGIRELEEETRGVINIKSGEFSEFEFKSSYRSPEETRRDRGEGVIVTLMYHVYIVNLTITPDEQKEVVKKFHENRLKMEINKIKGVHIKKAYDENDDISFDTLEEFNKKSRWSLIIKNIIDNAEFYKLLNSPNMKNFNVCSL